MFQGYGVLCYFGMLRLIAEVSTPAMNQRYIYLSFDLIIHLFSVGKELDISKSNVISNY